MQNTEYSFSLSKSGWLSPININFKNSTDGQISESRTEVKLSYDDDYFYVHVECLDDPFVEENYMTMHNEPLYNQEVFEVFISAGAADAKQYLEVEINPNNAIWIGVINNPTLGAEMQTLDHMVEYADAGIMHSASKAENSWQAGLSIPWDLIGRDNAGEYRLNFYRIRLKQKLDTENWISNGQNCDFLCWSPTMAGAEPAFHRPKMFGKMTLS